MRKIVLFFLVFLVSMIAGLGQARAFNYLYKCDSAKELTDISTVMTAESPGLCTLFSASGFNCFDSKKSVLDPKYIYLGTPLSSYYGIKKKSDLFLRSAVQEIIESSVNMNLDPYAVLSIVLMENAPLPGHQGYANDYGNPPIDVGAFRQTWNCQANGPQLGTPNISIPPGPNPRLKKVTTWLCEQTEQDTKSWQSPTLALGHKEDNCCARVQHFETDEYELERKVKGQTALMFVKRYFSQVQNLRFFLTTQNPNDKMALLLQGYNGYGTIGRGEGSPNRCLSGLQMRDQPIYGAGAADIMINFLMGNSEVRGFVQDVLEKLNRKNTPSYLCQIYGEGYHFLSPTVFGELQTSYLAGRPACTAKAKASAVN